MKGKSILKKWWFWVIVVFVIIIAFSGRNNNPGNRAAENTTTQNTTTQNTTTQNTTTQNTTAQNTTAQNTTESTAQNTTATTQQNTSPSTDTAAWIKEGMYKVGSDIASGEYVIYSDSAINSYFQVSKDSTGSLDSIITNDNFTGNRYITLTDGQYLQLQGAKMLPIANADPLSPVDGKYAAGMYKVGRDIKPGEYKVTPDGSGNSYIEVTKDSTGVLDSIISNDNFTGEKYITISDGQYIKLVGCYIAV